MPLYLAANLHLRQFIPGLSKSPLPFGPSLSAGAFPWRRFWWMGPLARLSPTRRPRILLSIPTWVILESVRLGEAALKPMQFLFNPRPSELQRHRLLSLIPPTNHIWEPQPFERGPWIASHNCPAPSRPAYNPSWLRNPRHGRLKKQPREPQLSYYLPPRQHTTSTVLGVGSISFLNTCLSFQTTFLSLPPFFSFKET